MLCAAERVVARCGMAALTMDAVAAEAGVGKGTVFRRFGDRAGLARALLSERGAALQEAMIRGAPPLGPGAPATERLVAYGRAQLAFLEDHAELVAAADAGLPGARLEAAPYAVARTHVALLLREADPSLDAEVLADVLLAALTADVFLALRRGRTLPLARLEAGWEQLVHRLLRVQ